MPGSVLRCLGKCARWFPQVVPGTASEIAIDRHRKERPPPHLLTPRSESELGLAAGYWIRARLDGWDSRHSGSEVECSLSLRPGSPGRIVPSIPSLWSGRAAAVSELEARRRRGAGREGCPGRREPSHIGARCGLARCCRCGTRVRGCTLRTIGSSPGSTRDHDPRG